jgi:ketosteroid isomerase-like protein
MSQQNLDIVRNAYAAFGRGDIPSVVATFDQNIEWVSPPGSYRVGGVHKGADAIIKNFFMVLGEIWENLDVTPREYVDAGDRVFVLGTARGKGKATGKPVAASYVHIFEFKNGKVARFEEYEDTATIREALQPVASTIA